MWPVAPSGETTMAVKATFAAAVALAIAIAMLLPVPNNRSEAHSSSIPTIEVGRG